MSINNNEVLDKLKRKELNILIEFDKVCKQLGINYTLSSGTLLGAVRHKGFIPWDDDIDVCMLREDYEIFLKKGQELFPENLFIQTHETDRNYPYNYCKIRDTSTELIEESTQMIPMKTGIFIDVFPIDRISNDPKERARDQQKLMILSIIKFSSTIEWAKQSNSRIRGMIRRILYPVAKGIGTYRLNVMETNIKIKNNKPENKYTYADNYVLPPNQLKDYMLLPIELFDDLGEIEFENLKFQAIKDTHSYLTALYGDYMQFPPEEERVSVHYYCKLSFND